MSNSVQPEGQRSYYEILAISPSASHEEIEQACVDLWYRHQPMRSTSLWPDLSKHVEAMRSTLLDPKTRATYDKLQVEQQSESFLIHQYQVKSDERSRSAASKNMQAAPENNHLLKKPRMPFRRVGYCIATGTSLMFNQTLDWMKPENGSDIETIGWLVLFFGLATTLLCWSAFMLIQRERQPVTGRSKIHF